MYCSCTEWWPCAETKVSNRVNGLYEWFQFENVILLLTHYILEPHRFVGPLDTQVVRGDTWKSNDCPHTHLEGGFKTRHDQKENANYDEDNGHTNIDFDWATNIRLFISKVEQATDGKCDKKWFHNGAVRD